MYINNFKVGFVVVFFTIVSFSSNTLNAQNQRPQTSSKQTQLKPIVIVPGKPRTIKVSPDQYAGIDFKSTRLVNLKKKPGQRAIVSNIALN